MRDKRKALETIIEKLAKLLPHLGNENDGEALAAVRAISALLKKAKLDWHDLVMLLSGEQDSFFEFLGKFLEKPEDTLVRLGRERASLFHSAERLPFADVSVDGHRMTWSLLGDEFVEWLLHQYFLEKKKAPPAAAVKAAVRTLSAHARFEGERYAVYLRVAEVDGCIFFDLANEQGQVVEITPNGWRIVERPHVRFRRAPGMAAMPLPQRGGKIDDLRRFINLSADDFILYVVTLLDAFRPGRPHPVLYISGEEGSGKSAAGKIARDLTDPSDVAVSTLSETPRDLFAAVHNAHSIAFDNISKITPKISDALCQISSGSGYRKRAVYTDAKEFRVVGSRFIILNGIANAITRPDLADRAVILPASPIRPEQRRSDVAFWRAFGAARPRILGALFDVVSHGLREAPFVELGRKPRMADFALWGIACEGAFAGEGAFLRAFAARAAEAVEVVIEEDPVATAIAALMLGCEVWTGTAAQLLAELTNRDRTEAGVASQHDWPKDPTRLSQRLRKLAATLRKGGIEVAFGKAVDRRRTRVVELRTVRPADEHPQQTRKRRRTHASGRSDAADAADTAQKTGLVIAFPQD